MRGPMIWRSFEPKSCKIFKFMTESTCLSALPRATPIRLQRKGGVVAADSCSGPLSHQLTVPRCLALIVNLTSDPLPESSPLLKRAVTKCQGFQKADRLSPGGVTSPITHSPPRPPPKNQTEAGLQLQTRGAPGPPDSCRGSFVNTRSFGSKIIFSNNHETK